MTVPVKNPSQKSQLFRECVHGAIKVVEMWKLWKSLLLLLLLLMLMLPRSRTCTQHSSSVLDTLIPRTVAVFGHNARAWRPRPPPRGESPPPRRRGASGPRLPGENGSKGAPPR
jgi:hypothetical protein